MLLVEFVSSRRKGESLLPSLPRTCQCSWLLVWLFPSETEDKRQSCCLSNYYSVKKGETVFDVMKRNEGLNCLRMEETK